MMEQRRLILILGAVFLALVCPSSEVPKNKVRHEDTGSASAADEVPESNLHEEDDYYQEFLGVPMASSTDDFGVKGRPGIDFPNLAAIPVTSFTCRNVKESGYFADMETKCQVFHICDGGRKMSFLCPNGTIFRQSHLICDWWFRVDCDDSQDFYEPSADTLRRDRERVKLDRMASESRESMSITTEFDTPIKQNPRIQENGRIYYETTQPLDNSNQRTTTVPVQIRPGDEINIKSHQQRKGSSQIVKVYQHEELEPQGPKNVPSNSQTRRTRIEFHPISEEQPPKANIPIKPVINNVNTDLQKQIESRSTPNQYFKQPETITQYLQNYDRVPEEHNTEINTKSSADENFSANRRIDTVKRKPDCIHDDSEGQVLAETASFAGSHRRGRLESVTFSRVTETTPVFELSSSKEDKTDDSLDTDNQGKEDETDLMVTTEATKDDDLESVITYRPIMALEKYLNQRREQLTKNDGEEEEKESRNSYTGARTPPNIPLSSGPGAVHSLALYIATGGDNLVHNTPRRIEGSLKGIIPTDPIPVEQPRSLSLSQASVPTVSERPNFRLPQSPTLTGNYKSLSFIKEVEPQSSSKDLGSRKVGTTQSPVIITAPNKHTFEHTTKSPIFNLETSNPSHRIKENEFPSNSASAKDIPYVLVTSSLSGRGNKRYNSRVKSSNIQYLPTTSSANYDSEKIVTDKIPSKIAQEAKTEPPSLDINLVTTFLPKDTVTPDDISYKSAKKESEFVNIRSPIISTLTKKDDDKTNKTTVHSENKGRSLSQPVPYISDPDEYSNTLRPTTINDAESNSFFEKEQYFKLDKTQTTTKDSGSFLGKQFHLKTEVNHKKSDISAKKMKDYLLGNYTSDESGLFQHINKALEETNTTNLTEDTMSTLYKNAIEPTLKEVMASRSITEPFTTEITTNEEQMFELHTENPNTTEDVDETTKEIEESLITKAPPTEAIQLTPFFRVENGKVTSTDSKFPQDDDLSTTPSDLRELAQVFSRALSAYLEDPETFREALASVSHPPNPTLPSGVLSDSSQSESNIMTEEEDDEVLDFSDVQAPTTTTPHKTETTSSKPKAGFYITIPFTTPNYKNSEKYTNLNKQNNLSQQDAEGPNNENLQISTTFIPPTVTTLPIRNETINLSEQQTAENITNPDKKPSIDKEQELSDQTESNVETTTIKVSVTKTTTENNYVSKEDPLPLSHDKPLDENLPPLEVELLPPFQDPIPDHEGLRTDDENDGHTEINIPTAALDEILNEFVPEELNRLAMTSIEPEEIPDNKNYLSSLVPNSLSTYDFPNSDTSTTPSSIKSSTTPISSTIETILNSDEALLSRLSAKLSQANSQGKGSAGTSQTNTLSYDTFTNQLLKAVANSVTEKDESLVRAQSANFLPLQQNLNTFQGLNSDKSKKLSISEVEKSSLPLKEEISTENTTPTLSENKDYEFINITTEITTAKNNDPNVPKKFNTTELESLSGENEDQRSFQGNPRLVLLFVNDHNARGRGINEKNARLLKALLRKDDHHILQSAGLISDENKTREYTSTTEYNPYTITSVAPNSHSMTTTTTTTANPHQKQEKADPEVRTEPPITTYAPKFTMTWLPFKKPRSANRNNTVRSEKLQATEPAKHLVEETTTPIPPETSTSTTAIPTIQSTTASADTSSILGGEDKSMVSDGRAFDLLRSLYSLTAKWG